MWPLSVILPVGALVVGLAAILFYKASNFRVFYHFV